MNVKILLADDHPLILKGTKEFLNEIGYNNVITSVDGQQAYNAVLKEKPEILILDYNMPRMKGLELAKLCRKEKLDVKIILLTLQKNELILKEVGKRINAYLLKEDALDKLKECLETIQCGENYISSNLQKSVLSHISSGDFMIKLTSSEIKVLKQIARNRSSQEIADTLFISKRTVEKHRSNMIQKLELTGGKKSLQQFVIANKDQFEF